VELRRIAVIGAGAMGASLAAIVSAHVPTVLVARQPARAARIRAAGIRLHGKLTAAGRPTVVPAIDALAAISPIDLVVVATKTTAIPAVCAAMQPHLAALPYVVSYQNGIEPGRTIIRTLGTPRVLRMVLNYGAVIEDEGADGAPLSVRVALHEPPHLVGGEGAATEVARALAPRFDAMGLPMRFTADIEAAAWHKGIANAAGNSIAALARLPLGALLDSPARTLIEHLLDEGIAVARAAGIALPPSYRDDVLGPMARGGAHLPSMAEDVMAGRPTEVTQLNEQIARRGRELGIPTPTHDTIIALIRTFDWHAARHG
jgi:2-dehydropantoate 2-reductase